MNPDQTSLDYLISLGIPRNEAIRFESAMDQATAGMTRDEIRKWFQVNVRKCLDLKARGYEFLTPPGFERT